MATSPIIGIAEKHVYRPVFTFYVRLVKRISLGGILVLLTLPVFPTLHYYAYLFLEGSEILPARLTYAGEIEVYRLSFWLPMLLYAILGGLFTRIGVPPLPASVRAAGSLLRKLTGEETADDLRRILVLLNRIPAAFTYLALIAYALQTTIVYGYSLAQGSGWSRVAYFAILDLFLIVMLAGLVYSTAEFCCGYLRVQVKKLLSGHDEPANDTITGRSGLIRFLYLLFLGGTSTIALILFAGNKSKDVLPYALQFSAITFIICGSLAFIYFFVWSHSLRQISEATYSVAMGGRGNLPLLSNDREMVDLAVNFDSATYEINTIRNYLTELVDEKTRTISEAYNELKHLKSRQDGDYYLTSILIESLTEIRPESDTVVIDSLLKQFKTFEFMEHSKEIGGDMNAGYALWLQGEKYTLVVNADAMGKSLQGAGGVLVLGSAFRSLIERTHITEGLRDLSPERWLKNSFLELHRLFSSFNGSMMASMICLLIHDASGYTVMINAEHPQGILLRNGVVEFISNHEGLRKMGNNAVKGRLWVDTLILQKRDVVILGSDGRDDLVVGYDEGGQPMMNEDDRRILDVVRLAQGDLPRIFLGIRNLGEIVDDVSLMKIEYAGATEREIEGLQEKWQRYMATSDAALRLIILREILELDPNNLRGWRALLRTHMRSKNLVDAASVSECLVRVTPQNDFYMYVAALLFFRTGNLDKSLNYADRLTLRNWKIGRYLILLGRIHTQRGDAHGMREAGLLLTELNPSHPYGRELLTKATQPI
jgi:hypothetical protein